MGTVTAMLVSIVLSLMLLFVDVAVAVAVVVVVAFCLKTQLSQLTAAGFWGL